MDPKLIPPKCFSAVIVENEKVDLYLFSCYSYQHNNGQMRLRVTTLSRRWVAGAGSIQVLSAVFLYMTHYHSMFLVPLCGLPVISVAYKLLKPS